MGNYKSEFKGYSRKGIIKNTEWSFTFFEVKEIMKREYRIKKIVENIKYILKICIKVISWVGSKLTDIDGFDNYNAEKLSYNNYEKCRLEISLQMQRDRILF